MNSRRRTARKPTTAAARPRGLSILGRCLQRRGPSSRKRRRRDRADRDRVNDVGPPNARRSLFFAIGLPTTPPKERGPPTAAAPTFQTKIAKTVAPSKTSVHASGIANHNGLCLMAYPKPRWSTASCSVARGAAPNPGDVSGRWGSGALRIMREGTRGRHQCNCNRCGWKAPNAVIATPASVRIPEIHASAMMPVMMAADASTIAIWKAADPSSK